VEDTQAAASAPHPFKLELRSAIPRLWAPSPGAAAGRRRSAGGRCRALAPVIADSVPAGHPVWLAEGLLLEAIARDMPSDAGAAQCPIERALDLAKPGRMLFPSLIHRRLDCLSAAPGSVPRTPP
jgi:hypothetical protein